MLVFMCYQMTWKSGGLRGERRETRGAGLHSFIVQLDGATCKRSEIGFEPTAPQLQLSIAKMN